MNDRTSATEESPLLALIGIIESLSPRSCLLCSQTVPPELEDACAQLNCSLSVAKSAEEQGTALPQQRFDLAIVADCLEHISLQDGQQLLGTLRNIHSNHLAVLVAEKLSMDNEESDSPASAKGWTDSAFYSLGMKHYASFNRTNEQRLRLYTYAIESYNHKREWNTARFWANPENFNRYWW